MVPGKVSKHLQGDSMGAVGAAHFRRESQVENPGTVLKSEKMIGFK